MRRRASLGLVLALCLAPELASAGGLALDRGGASSRRRLPRETRGCFGDAANRPAGSAALGALALGAASSVVAVQAARTLSAPDTGWVETLAVLTGADLFQGLAGSRAHELGLPAPLLPRPLPLLLAPGSQGAPAGLWLLDAGPVPGLSGRFAQPHVAPRELLGGAASASR